MPPASTAGEERAQFAKQMREALNAMQGAIEILRVSEDDATRRRMQDVLERQLATLIELTSRLASPGEGAPRREAAAPTVGRRILVVDDNADSAEVLATLLGQLGHAVAVAYDGASALATAGTHRPEVAFLDLALPDMSGFEVARRLRADPTQQGLRIIGLTGFGSEEHRKRSAVAGLDDYVVKPVDADTLIGLLRG